MRRSGKRLLSPAIFSVASLGLLYKSGIPRHIRQLPLLCSLSNNARFYGDCYAHIWRSLNDGEYELNIESLNRNIGATGIDLTTQINAKLSNGVKINALSSFEEPEKQEIAITGESATIQCIGNDAFTSWKKPSSLRIGNRLEEFAPVDPYSLMIENFSNAISGKPAWIPALDQSLYVAKLLDQIGAFNK